MDQSISYSLPITIFREGELFVAYTPLLDLSSTGKTEEDAKRMFAEAVEVFFEELQEMGTLDSVLKDLGWTKENQQFEPPKVVEHSLLSVHVPAGA
jgi:predicted RNase H-like HicB family nuclease